MSAKPRSSPSVCVKISVRCVILHDFLYMLFDIHTALAPCTTTMVWLQTYEAFLENGTIHDMNSLVKLQLGSLYTKH